MNFIKTDKRLFQTLENYWLAFKSRQLWRPLIFLAVLIISSYLAPRFALGNQLPRLIILPIILLIVGGGVSIILIRHPNLGFAILIVASLAIPFTIGTGSESPINASVLILGFLIFLWLADMFIQKRQLRFLSSKPIAAILAFLVASIIGYGFGQLNWFSVQGAPSRAQFGGFLIFLLSAGAFLVIAHQANLQGLKWMTGIFLALGALYIVGRFIPQLSSLTLRLGFFKIGSIDSLFWTWLVAIAFSQAFLNSHLGLPWRVALGILVCGTFLISFGYTRDWTSGWLPALAAVVIILFAAKPRIGIFALLIAGIFLFINSQTSENLVLQGNQYSLTTRVEAWAILGNIIKVNPIFGTGFANYYFYTALFPINGYYVPFNSHNNYVDLVAQTGLLGTACFFWFFWTVGRLGWRLRNRVHVGFEQAYVYGALGGLVGTLVAAFLGDWVLPFVYNIGLNGFRSSILAWLFLGGLIAIENLNKAGSREIGD
jgi:O-antigen ligase